MAREIVRGLTPNDPGVTLGSLLSTLATLLSLRLPVELPPMWRSIVLFPRTPLGASWLARGVDGRARVVLVDARRDADALQDWFGRRAYASASQPCLCLCVGGVGLTNELRASALSCGVIPVVVSCDIEQTEFYLRCALLQHAPAPEYGTVIDVAGHGVMLSGDAGVGKTSLALALVHAGHALVVDDAPLLRRVTYGVIAECPPEWSGCFRLGSGKVRDVRADFHARAFVPSTTINLIVHLIGVPDDAAPPRAHAMAQTLLGHALPTLVTFTANLHHRMDVVLAAVGRIIPQVA